MYNKKEVLEAALDYFEGDMLAAESWVNKYALKEGSDFLELTPHDMHKRLISGFIGVEVLYKNPLKKSILEDQINNFKKIIPQGGLMAGIGNTKQLTSLSNCFVIASPHDSYQGILKTEAEMISLMKRRGGVGFAIDSLRPKNIATSSVANKSSGIVLFAERYSNATREVAQDGRRGALMLSCRVDHPDIKEFIQAKADPRKINGANVSIAITRDFMTALLKEENYTTYFNTQENVYKYEESAKEVWGLLTKNAHKSAEPGILFIDTIDEENPAKGYGLKWKVASTNPCGEIPLPPLDACRLLALNLLSFVENPYTDKSNFNMHEFRKSINIAQRLMDDMIDLEIAKIISIITKIEQDNAPADLKKTELDLWTGILEKTIQGRRTGLGITATGDMLAALNLRYGTRAATNFMVMIHKELAIQSYSTSIQLAKERGCFPIWDLEKDKESAFINRMLSVLPKDIVEKYKKYGRRNIGNLTIAPTGTVSILTKTTSGIEPVFAVSYNRRRKVAEDEAFTFIDDLGDKWVEYKVFHKGFKDWYDLNWHKLTATSFDEKVDLEDMNEEALSTVFKASPYYKATSNDVDWVEKVSMQGAIQEWVDHSISVTVNMPEKTTVNEVDKVYKAAYIAGCKGITVYRDGSRQGVLVTKKEEEFKENHSPKRPKRLEAEIVRFWNSREKWVAVVGLYKGKPYEIFTGKADNLYIPQSIDKGFITKDKSGEVSRYDFEYLDKSGITQVYRGLSTAFDKEFYNYAKLISGTLRHGMPLNAAINVIRGLSFDSEDINTWKAGVARALKKFIPEDTDSKEKCPQCGGKLIYKEGCLACESCSYSKCG